MDHYNVPKTAIGAFTAISLFNTDCIKPCDLGSFCCFYRLILFFACFHYTVEDTEARKGEVYANRTKSGRATFQPQRSLL